IIEELYILMKKIVKYVVLVVSLLLISQTPVSANDNQRYVSDNQESRISHVVFTPDNDQLPVSNEAREAREIILLLSKHTDEALLARLDPNAECYDLQVLQDKLGISFNAIEDQFALENNPTAFNVSEQIQHASSGI